MEALSSLVKVTLPNYLSNLPIPDSFTGWFKLGSEYYMQYLLKYFLISFKVNFIWEKSID